MEHSRRMIYKYSRLQCVPHCLQVFMMLMFLIIKKSQLSYGKITFNTKPSLISQNRHGLITTEELSSKLMIAPKQVMLTLENTTQRGIRSAQI